MKIYKVHLRTHPNGFTCCGPARNGLDSTGDTAKVTCLKGRYAARLIPSFYTGPKNRAAVSWTARVEKSIVRSMWKSGDDPDWGRAARNVLSMLHAGGWACRASRAKRATR